MGSRVQSLIWMNECRSGPAPFCLHENFLNIDVLFFCGGGWGGGGGGGGGRGPHNKDVNMLGSMLGSLYLRKLPYGDAKYPIVIHSTQKGSKRLLAGQVGNTWPDAFAKSHLSMNGSRRHPWTSQVLGYDRGLGFRV